jgi:DNA processing protein
MTAAAQDERLARATLTYLAEPGDPWLAALVRECGAPRAVAAVREGRFPAGSQPGGGGRPALRAIERWRVRLGEVPQAGDLARLRDHGIRLLCPGDPQWPAGLAALADGEPYALWLRGAMPDLADACRRSVAIVGSRAATAYGSYVAAEMAATLAARGWTVVSGGAYGIDGCAHRGALAGSGVSIAVMACGVDRHYPAGHTQLLDAVAAGGAIVSEWPPGRSPTRIRFLVRNRVIAAMTGGTLVIEAGRRSGALNTARHARDLCRPLMAVPGPVTSDLSAGCHSVIRDWNGVLVTGADDVIECLSSDAGIPRAGHGRDPAVVADTASAAVPPADTAAGTSQARDALDREAYAVLDALPARGGMSTGDLSVRSGLTPGVVLGKLAMLTVGGFAERTDTGWKASRRAKT